MDFDSPDTARRSTRLESKKNDKHQRGSPVYINIDSSSDGKTPHVRGDAKHGLGLKKMKRTQNYKRNRPLDIGYPNGELKIKPLKSSSKSDEVTKEWRKQYPSNKKRIFLHDVVDCMTQQKDGGDMFKLNYLVLFVSIMIEGIKCGTVNQKFLPRVKQLINVRNMDWCSYLVESLKKTREEWTERGTYNGPLTFLVVFYANSIKSMRSEVNLVPAIKNWTSDKLNAIEKEELETGGFGMLQPRTLDNDIEDNDDNVPIQTLMMRKRRLASQKSDDDDHVTLKQRMEQMKKLKFGKECVTEKEEGIHDVHEDANHVNKDEDVEFEFGPEMEEMCAEPETVAEYKSELETKMFVLDTIIDEINVMLKNALKKYPEEDIFQNMKDELDEKVIIVMDDDEEGNMSGGDDSSEEEDQTYLTITQQFEQDKYMYDTQFMAEIVETEKLMSASKERAEEQTVISEKPTFDLQLSPPATVCIGSIERGQILSTEIGSITSREVTIVKWYKNHEPNIGDIRNGQRLMQEQPMDPQPLAVVHPEVPMVRPKRVVHATDVLLSPYISRVVNLEKSLTITEKRVSDCIFSCRFPTEYLIFKSGDLVGERGVIESLHQGEHVLYGVIDIWSTLLNQEEKRRDRNSVCRLFTNSTITNDLISKKNGAKMKMEKFMTNMKQVLLGGAETDINKIDLVFFPIKKAYHFDILCYHLGIGQVHILDNMHTEDDNVHKIYGDVPLVLTSAFVNYLLNEDHVNALKIGSAKPRIIRTSWRTKMNFVDGGVFTMRHMETYKGNGCAGFQSELKKEGPEQNKQIENLRIKYLTKILLSEENILKKKVMEEVEEYEKMPGFEKQKWKQQAETRISERVHEMIKKSK